MATILITGATGTVGSILASSLESRGHKLVFIIRPKGSENIEERLARLFGPHTNTGRIGWEGDIEFPQCGVKNQTIQAWKGKIEKIIHCASLISFDKDLKALVFNVNVDGTNNAIALATALGIPEFHYISTAYVAGDADYFTENDFDIGQTLRNPYEASKLEAEKLVRKHFPGQYSIYRLGIVVGDSSTGYTPQFNGYYRPFAFFFHLRERLKSTSPQILEKYKKEGIAFDGNNLVLNLPIKIICSPVSTLNLVPRDWVAEIISNLLEVRTAGKVFHIVHPRPKKTRWIIDNTFSCLGVKGYSYGGQKNSNPPLLSVIQKAFDRDTRPYLPYIIHEAKFTTVNTINALGSKSCFPAEIDETFLRVEIGYAESVSFGKHGKGKITGGIK